MRLILKFVGRETSWILGLSVLCGLLLFVVELFLAYLLQHFFGTIGILSQPKGSFFLNLNTGPAVSLLLTLAVFRSGVRYFQDYSGKKILETFRALQRNRLATWALDNRGLQTGHLFELFNEKVVGSSSVLRAFQQTMIQGLAALFLFSYLVYLSWAVSLSIVGLGFIVLVAVKSLRRDSQDFGSLAANESAQVSARLMVAVKNILFLRLYSLEKKELEGISSRINRYRDFSLDVARRKSFQQIIPEFVGLVLVILIGSLSSVEAVMDQTVLVSYLYLLIRFAQNLSMTLSHQHSLLFYRPQLKELFQWWKKTSLEPVREDELGSTALSLQAPLGWQISNLNIYTEGRPLIENLNLDIQPCDFLLIQGDSGSGKSSFLASLVGELPLKSSGSITVLHGGNTHELERIQTEVKCHLGYVGADPYLIAGSVRENLSFGCLRSIRDEEMIAALETADCGFILTSEEGLDKVISEQGEGLSTGQKQRLQLARAILRKPLALILDEPSANLDESAELRLFKIVSELRKQMTVVVVSHNRAIEPFATKRLVLKGDGSWDAL